MWKTAFKLAVVLLLLPGVLKAHDARPLYLQINEVERAHSEAFHYTLKLQVPPSVETSNRPYLTLPDTCDHERMGMIIQVTCSAPLAGESVHINWPEHNPSISTLVRSSFSSGASYQQLLAPSESHWQVPTKRSTWAVASEYSSLGIEHILIGWDHLLFLLCLIWIAGTFKRTLITVTGFTLAHSVTLALTTLGMIRLPIAPVEAVIAMSILFLAAEIIRNRRDTFAWRYPVAVSTLFGLIHGFGFASVLQDIGLPKTDLGTALLFFNIGVEIGQVLFVGTVAALLSVLRRWGEPMASAAPATIYGVGSLAAFWTLERVAGF
ncbi:HupE/UreJ family protein [Marinobacter sp. F4216]|uniref:HupE/UreJ family protein n=1 Tax=Marinobacter sp. F4216 TaxID=2874281 RepID=UPI001CBE9839|nr:HupE/UreJ family protein [Marinobacter sp. F4216]MBZ2168375.1 HupE/UreJ family protein [Marinobacter sp. F4216]